MGNHCLFRLLHRYIDIITVFHILDWPILFINIFIEQNIYWFCRYHSKGGSFFGETIVSTIRLILLYWKNYVSVWLFMTTHLHYLSFFSKHMIRNQLSSATATIDIPVVSDNRQSLFFCLLYLYTYMITVLHIFD